MHSTKSRCSEVSRALPAPMNLVTTLREAIAPAVINKRAGGSGLIWGRKTFQRPMEEGVKLFHAIQDIYLSPEVTIAWQYTSNANCVGR